MIGGICNGGTNFIKLNFNVLLEMRNFTDLTEC